MTKFQDLTGKKFGKWNVVEYLGKQNYSCVCDCGTHRIVSVHNLRNGKTTSCGCGREKNLTGKKIDRLTVLRKLPMTKSYVEYECQCDCGAIITKTYFGLTHNKELCCPDCKIPQIEDISGQKFGRLTVIRYAGKSQSNQTMWECQCECGNTITAQAQNLKNGHTKSCGCYNIELTSKRNRTHGETRTRLYNIWHDMCYRCYGEKHHSYYLYGAKGITVCDEWKNSFEKFRDWALQNGYADNLSIDRIDSTGNYEPSNCRWATDLVQANNTNRNRYFTIDGITDTLANWCRKYNMPYATVSSRIRGEWDIVDALTLPIGQKWGAGHRNKRKAGE